MKLFISLLLSLLILLAFECSAAELDKSTLTSDHSSLDENGGVVFSSNVIYKHGEMTIKADKLTRSEQGLIHVSGVPVKIHYLDELGQVSDISANEFDYQEKSGALDSQGNIKIIQRTAKDTLTLQGTNLKANKKISKGFSFVLTGKPTHFTIKQPDQEDIFVVADQLRSNGKDKQTQLLGNVKLTQGTSSTAAPILTYNGQTGIISAHQDSSGEQRVKTEFFWEKSDDDAVKEPQAIEEVIEEDNTVDSKREKSQ